MQQKVKAIRFGTLSCLDRVDIVIQIKLYRCVEKLTEESSGMKIEDCTREIVEKVRKAHDAVTKCSVKMVQTGEIKLSRPYP